MLVMRIVNINKIRTKPPFFLTHTSFLKTNDTLFISTDGGYFQENSELHRN